jgi:hypothetical protein
MNRISDICEVCKCCSLIWIECDQCDEFGYSGHDCGEDTCMCRYPEDNIRCDYCFGKRGWYVCVDKECNYNK